LASFSESSASHNQTVVYLSCDDQVVAEFTLTDSLREGAAEAIAKLKADGICVEILSGDNENAVSQIAQMLNIGQYRSNCNADQKLNRIQQLQNQGKTVMMLGDGVNDAPIIAAADISLAMSTASELTRSHADIYQLGESLDSISALQTKAKQTNKILKQNFIWALGYNFSALPIAASGAIPPWLAAIGMSTSSLIVILNAIRASRVTKTGSDHLTQSNTQIKPESLLQRLQHG
jgi:Cu2+-exporting ATPase